MAVVPSIQAVDLEPFRRGGVIDRLGIARQIDVACRDVGFLQLTGHGVPEELCDRVLEAWSVFFDQADEEKRRFVVADEAANRGYSWLGKEALAYSRGEETPPDQFEAFTVGRDDLSDPYFTAHSSFFAPSVWPDVPAGLRDVMAAYEAAAAETCETVLAAMALALDLPTGWFGTHLRHAVVTRRALNYPEPAATARPDREQMRLGAHTDYGILTVLLADDAPGLQVLRDGRWHDVATPRGTLTCNIGDMLARWTNDRWTSTLHRVVPPAASGTSRVRRRSVARFLDCPPDLVVDCMPSCCSATNPARYEPVVAGDWLLAKLVGARTRVRVELPAGAS